MTAAPTVVVPVQAPAPGLDACLAALERSLPDGAPVLVADDACADPRIGELAAGWCGRTRLRARYLRRPQALGFAGNVEAAFADVPEGDLVLLRCDGEATAGWLSRLQQAADADPRAASVAAWSGENELAAYADTAAPAAVAEAAASLDWPSPPSLPAAAGPALYLRRAAVRAVGGLDSASFPGWGALDDLCRRAEALGWRNLLCPSAFVGAHDGASGSGATLGEIERLQMRWPDFQERVARFILEDPLRPLRERLRARIIELASRGPQGDLFGH